MLESKANMNSREIYFSTPDSPIFKNLILLQIPPLLNLSFDFFEDFQKRKQNYTEYFLIKCRKFKKNIQQKITFKNTFKKKSKNIILKTMKKLKKQRIKNFYN